MQRKSLINFMPRFPDGGARNGFCLDFRAHTRLLANVRQISGEAIAQIDHRRSQPLLPQNAAEFDPRCGIETAGKVGGTKSLFRVLPENLQRCCRCSEFSAYVEAVSGARPRPQYRLAFGNRTE